MKNISRPPFIFLATAQVRIRLVRTRGGIQNGHIYASVIIECPLNAYWIYNFHNGEVAPPLWICFCDVKGEQVNPLQKIKQNLAMRTSERLISSLMGDFCSLYLRGTFVKRFLIKISLIKISQIDQFNILVFNPLQRFFILCSFLFFPLYSLLNLSKLSKRITFFEF